ncbi:uncharacterized protein ACOB8E_006623 [Sarcophilus harrisii]
MDVGNTYGTTNWLQTNKGKMRQILSALEIPRRINGGMDVCSTLGTTNWLQTNEGKGWLLSALEIPRRIHRGMHECCNHCTVIKLQIKKAEVIMRLGMLHPLRLEMGRKPNETLECIMDILPPDLHFTTLSSLWASIPPVLPHKQQKEASSGRAAE